MHEHTGRSAIVPTHATAQSLQFQRYSLLLRSPDCARMKKILVVVGATGQQGSSVINSVLDDAELSQAYTIRAITRSIISPTARELAQRGVSLVQADLNDRPSTTRALRGAHTLFCMTAPDFSDHSRSNELAQAKAMGDLAVAEGLDLIIFSTLPHVARISNGKYTKVDGFDAKAEAEEYIRTLSIKSAFISLGSFMQNYQRIMRPQQDGHGGYVIARPMSPEARLPLVDTEADAGKFVGAILAAPEKFNGKVMCAATALYTLEQQASIISKMSRKRVVYQQISTDQFEQLLGPLADTLLEMMQYQEEFGYYGPNTEELVAWSVENARGKVNSFEEYLTRKPLNLL